MIASLASTIELALYGIYLMGLVSIGSLEGYEDLGRKSFY